MKSVSVQVSGVTTVTCVIALHREGLLAHTTLSSIENARQEAELNGLSVGFVITLDCHDDLTERIARQHPGVRNTDIIEIVSYGDLGLSRNHGIAKASGEYIVCMDGDDYYSTNYIFSSVQEAQKDDQSVVHPEYIFSFGQEYTYVRIAGPDGGAFSAYALFSSHYYSSSLTARRDIFLQNPFRACAPGFGFEDWHWNCEAVASGFKHRPAIGTVLFYRRKPESMCRSYAQANAIVPPSRFFAMLPAPKGELLDLPEIPRTPLPTRKIIKAAVCGVLRSLPKGLGRNLYSKIVTHRPNEIAKKNLLRFIEIMPESWGTHIYLSLEGWWHARSKKGRIATPLVRNALFDVARIDGQLHPDRLPPVQHIFPHYDEKPGRVYATAWQSLSGYEYDIIYTAPHINVGGADLMTVNYVKAASSAGMRVLCLTINGTPNILKEIPENVDVLDLGNLMKPLQPEQRLMVLARLLVQLAPKRIHMVNDLVGFRCLQQYGNALRHMSKVFVSIFTDEQDRKDIFYGAGVDYLREFVPHVTKVITDNAVTSEDWEKRFGLHKDFFHPVYGVIANTDNSWSNPVRRDRVLWAGRLDDQKRLDILCEVAEKLPDIHFDVYGTLVLNKKLAVANSLRALSNVTLHGKYDGFINLPRGKHFALLYTTQYDGLPNVLLEATAAGLPVIAPDRGGIRDFITNKTGWLIANNTDIEAYITALREVQGNKEEAKVRWENAYALITERHSLKKFSQNLLEAYGV